MLKNSNFEEGMPNDWQTYTTGTTQRYIYPEPGRITGSSVSIECPNIEANKTASWIQTVIIDNTKKYKLSGWMYTENIASSAGGARIKVDWKDVDKKFLGESNIMIYQIGTIPWTFFEGDVIPHPNATDATIVLLLYNCSGRVGFDNISFSEIIPKYKCIDGICVEDPNGQYDTLADCEAAKKYACTNNACVKVCPDYQGIKYDTLADCEAAKKYACINDTCTKVCPDYQGIKYNTLSECQSRCKVGYTLVFEDDFNGNTLDIKKWTNTYGSYALQNSNLILGVSNNGGEIRGRTADKTAAKWQFKYGYVEFRAKLADTGTNKGYSNQLWFISSPGQSPYGEINITETATGPIDNNIGPHGINKMNTTVHCPTQPSAKSRRINTGLNLSKEYHIYAAEWTPTFVRFLLDGKEVSKIVSTEICIPNVFMYLVIGLCKRPVTNDPNVCWPAVQPGNVPAKMYVDYVRVFQKKV